VFSKIGYKKMDNSKLNETFQTLSTPLIADACLRLKIPLRIAPAGVRAIVPEFKIAGRVLPAQHYGSVDIFMEALSTATPGDILVIDNQGRSDEACIGDLVVLEAQLRKTAGIIVWGYHRDSAELDAIDLPVFSYGSYPAGPVRLDPCPADATQTASFGNHKVTSEDVVFADSDGIIFVPQSSVQAILETAIIIHMRERQQADRMRMGATLYDQLQFEDYLKKRKQSPAYTFRKHLRILNGEIEE
jgi:regulator of RNase E activity RraA